MNTTAGLLLGFQLLTGIPGQVVELKTSLNDWDNPPLRMTEVTPGSYSTSISTPWSPWVQYKFIVDGVWQADPRNPDWVADGYGGRNSVLETGFAEDPWLEPSAPLITQERLSISERSGDTREITALFPKLAGCVAIYFLDGGDYLRFARVRELLSNLRAYDSSLPCFAAALVSPRDRQGENTPGPIAQRFSRWLASTVVPAFETKTRSGGSPDRRLVIGPSLGGLGALLIALYEPQIFRRAGVQSGSFWWKDREILGVLDQATQQSLTGLRLHLHVGDLEAPLLLEANRALRQKLYALRIAHTYNEHPSQHDWLAWRNQLRMILSQAFPPALPRAAE